MTGQENSNGGPAMNGAQLYESWRSLGASVICRHDFAKSGLTFSAVIPAGLLVDAAKALIAAGYHLEDLSAMQVKEGYLVTYHFDTFANEPARVALRVLAGDECRLPSLAAVYQGAEWHERESADFLGLIFAGNPNPVALLLPPDFPDAPPLRRDEKNRAALADLGLFGQAEVLDPAWADLVAPPKAEEKQEGAE